MTRVAPIIEHEAKQDVLFRNKVAEGHLSFGHLSRRQELQPMTIVASNIEHRAQQEVLLKLTWPKATSSEDKCFNI